jgi:hypothetical protein
MDNPMVLTKDETKKAKLVIDFSNDTAKIDYYYDEKLVDSVSIPHANAVVDFVAKQTGYRENTVRRYIYKNKKDEFIDKGIVSFNEGSLKILDLEKLLNFFKKEK